MSLADYLRFENNNLETAIRTLEHPAKGTHIDLAGAIHLADAQYFAEVKDHLDALDLVLYEAVKSAPGAQVPPYLKLLRRAYGIAAKQMGFAYQMQAIDYDSLPANWEHCDLSEAQMAAVGKGLLYRKNLRNSSLMVEAEKILTESLDSAEQQIQSGTFPAIPRAAIGMLAKRMAWTMTNPIVSKLQTIPLDILIGKEAILDARNKVVCDRLEELTASGEKKAIGVFYGAMHLPDIERYLKEELGYEHRSSKWIPAWDC